MSTKAERIERQNALLAVHDAATAELMQIPGVVGVVNREERVLAFDAFCFSAHEMLRFS